MISTLEHVTIYVILSLTSYIYTMTYTIQNYMPHFAVAAAAGLALLATAQQS